MSHAVIAEVQGLRNGEQFETNRAPHPGEGGRIWRRISDDTYEGEQLSAPGDVARWRVRATTKDV
jgi:hypothetical protein